MQKDKRLSNHHFPEAAATLAFINECFRLGLRLNVSLSILNIPKND